MNASDFAIAQFRFLETLVLIHGRWNFFRLSTVVLFSFYKNAVMAGVIIYFAGRTLFSGTPIFDEWIVSAVANSATLLTRLGPKGCNVEFCCRGSYRRPWHL